MITRDSIVVWRETDLDKGTHPLHIQVNIDKDKSHGVSVVGEGNTMQAIDMLFENIVRKELGLTKLDLIVKVNDFFMEEKNAEERPDADFRETDWSSEGPTEV